MSKTITLGNYTKWSSWTCGILKYIQIWSNDQNLSTWTKQMFANMAKQAVQKWPGCLWWNSGQFLSRLGVSVVTEDNCLSLNNLLILVSLNKKIDADQNRSSWANGRLLRVVVRPSLTVHSYISILRCISINHAQFK